MSGITQKIISEIEEAVANGGTITAMSFNRPFRRANVSAAFKAAKRQGIIAPVEPGSRMYRKALRIAQ